MLGSMLAWLADGEKGTEKGGEDDDEEDGGDDDDTGR